MNAAEHGRVPDSVIRYGIRRLLKARLSDLESDHEIDATQRFIERTLTEPIAVQAAAANEQHYEVPSEFFQHVLGPRLKYSSSYWPDGVGSLEAAENEALRVTCENAGLEDGMKILELGCGWGSLSLWMADRYRSSQITSVSNSGSQRRYIEACAAESGLSNLRVVTADINDFSTEESFDRVVSVEMFEHMRNHRELTRRIHDWLSPDGKLFVHIFCHRRSAYLFETDGPQNWMGRHFFTGGMMPGADLLPRASTSMQVVNQWKWNGVHYAKSCRAWLENQDRAQHVLQSVLADTYGKDEAIRWHNRWRLFFMACEELFAFNGGNEWFVSHYLFAP
ncbi:MAG: cyclopropane-fatty-acyl-phospholipid synthase [Fuerstiella sp.]|nr:cyclopropane-fatty-acyl-phospholipid synthase [Fuerstiella sp.]